jgi:hypothetical protein
VERVVRLTAVAAERVVRLLAVAAACAARLREHALGPARPDAAPVAELLAWEQPGRLSVQHAPQAARAERRASCPCPALGPMQSHWLVQRRQTQEQSLL